LSQRKTEDIVLDYHITTLATTNHSMLWAVAQKTLAKVNKLNAKIRQALRPNASESAP